MAAAGRNSPEKRDRVTWDNGISHAENEARALYLDAAKYCESVKDRVTMNLFERLAGDEEGHVDFLESQLELIRQVGVQLYAQKHIGKLQD
jgi:bacterioferritin